MSWYDSAYAHRAVITIPEDADSGDVQVTIPTDWDLFWDTIQADGDDVRITDSNGVTLLTYEVSSFTYATRTMVIDIDVGSLSIAAGLIWIYFGNASATDGQGSFTQAGMDPGYIELGRPDGLVFDLQREEAGVEIPAQRFGKQPTDDLFVWFRLNGLQKRRTPYNGSWNYEEVAFAAADVLTGAASQAGMTDDSKIRLVEGDDGAMYGRVYVDDGSDATDYVVEFAITTTLLRVLRGRVLMQVRIPAEP